MLIEKDWLAFGHPFHLRHAYGLPRGSTSATENQRSPIFLQFLDCAWQLVMQLPSYFEFNPRYTVTWTNNIPYFCYVACFSVYRYFVLVYIC